MKEPKPLSNEEHMVIQKVVGILNQKELISCTKCNYCLDWCPQNIAISKYFELHNQVQLTNGAANDELKEEYEKTKVSFGAPKDCIKCKLCESVCPQHLTITDYLGKINWMFEK